MTLSIDAKWERLDSGPPEERACFAAIAIIANEICLTTAEDSFVNRLRNSVHLSSYKLAEWLAWNWWRLRWEPRTRAPDWASAHHMTTIGGGYVWPNITIQSDGERIALVAKPTAERLTEPLRYLVDMSVVMRASEFETAVDRFVGQVRGQLCAENVDQTNLDDIWDDVIAERTNGATAARRRFEALLGYDPDEAPADLLERLITDGKQLGENAVRELAATASGRRDVPSADDIVQIAQTQGTEMRPRDSVRLEQTEDMPSIGDAPPWVRGKHAAMALREQEGLGAEPLSNDRLAKMSGVGSLPIAPEGAGVSFALDRSPTHGRVVLRSRWETGRRFELARLLGDRLAAVNGGVLHPATRAFTYRQQMQRAFAAELLCPFAEADAMMQGDYENEERQEEVAAHFNVSPLTVRTELANHHCIDRDALDADCDDRVA